MKASTSSLITGLMFLLSAFFLRDKACGLLSVYFGTAALFMLGVSHICDAIEKKGDK